MALAWAQARQGDSGSLAASLLLGAGERGGPGAAAAVGPAPAERRSLGPAEGSGGQPPPLPARYVVVLTQVLPDGMGDLIFGESAVRELQDVAPVAWLRCYCSEESLAPGERLVADAAGAACFGLACSGREGFYAHVGTQDLEELWRGAAQRFLAPWIFGLSTHEEALLRLARKTGQRFFALTEYGRGMGNIHTYTSGLGAMIPTGWTLDHSADPGGVFKSILRAPRTGTDWRRVFAQHCGIAEVEGVRLYWFYSRKDDEKKHEFQFLERERGDGMPGHVRCAAKLIPITEAGTMAVGNEKTSGEKLAAQLFDAASDPSFKPNTDVTSGEVSTGCAGQLSQFIFGLITDPSFEGAGAAGRGRTEGADIIVAPNVFTGWRAESGGERAVARILQLDLVQRGGSRQAARLSGRRPLYVVSARIPRAEMRTFLDQCQERVFTTGDQSLTEAVLLGKIPCVRPDAKVHQWEAALVAKVRGLVGAVPDLGEELRRLVDDAAAQERALAASQARSEEVERHMVAQLGAPASAWAPAQQVLARSGMLG